MATLTRHSHTRRQGIRLSTQAVLQAQYSTALPELQLLRILDRVTCTERMLVDTSSWRSG